MVRRMLLALACVCAAGGQAAADEIMMPRARWGAACASFECAARVQLVFDGSLFSSGVKIRALSFFDAFNKGEGPITGRSRSRFYLSTRSFSSSGSGLGFNRGRGGRFRFDFDVEDDFDQSAVDSEPPSPFTFDPALGNLLPEVRREQAARHGGGGNDTPARVAQTVAALVSPIQPTGPQVQGPTSGLGGGVDAADGGDGGGTAAATPEPGSMILLGSGLAALVARRKLARRQAQ
jgi:hypothetical protein